MPRKGLDFDAFIAAFVLTQRNVFVHGRIFVIKVFSVSIFNEACIATDVMLIAIRTRDLVDGVSS